MKRQPLSTPLKLSPLLKPTARSLNKKSLNNLKTVRRSGIKDLKKYLKEIKTNIKVFQQAIVKEKKEMKRTRDMIQTLKNDIKAANALKKGLK